jgi:uncharacterized protein YecT (DUF1311 family)
VHLQTLKRCLNKSVRPRRTISATQPAIRTKGNENAANTANRFRESFSGFTVAAPAFAIAQSFDCKLARTGTEKLFCSDKALGSLDERIAAAYQRALNAHNGQIIGYVSNDQRAFQARLRAIDKPAGDTGSDCRPKDAVCLGGLLETRIEVLFHASTRLADCSIPRNPLPRLKHSAQFRHADADV